MLETVTLAPQGAADGACYPAAIAVYVNERRQQHQGQH
jgi:hypothetical protein